MSSKNILYLIFPRALRKLYIWVTCGFVTCTRSVRNVAYLPILAHHPLCSFIHLLLTLKWTLLPHTKPTSTTYMHVSQCSYFCVFQPSIIIFSQAHTLVRTYIFLGTTTLCLSNPYPPSAARIICGLHVHASSEFVFVAVKPNVWKLVYAPPWVFISIPLLVLALLKM